MPPTDQHTLTQNIFEGRTDLLVALIIGIALGAGIVFLFNFLQKRDARKIAAEVISQTENQKSQDLEMILGRIKDSFGAISLDALDKNSHNFLELANAAMSAQTQHAKLDLEGKKSLIDQTFESMKIELGRTQELVGNLEKDRERKFGELSDQLRNATEQTALLRDTTSQLQTALASREIRGQWGQRMAEDILNYAGFIEGVNYLKQKTMTGGTKPDYTFLLPQKLVVNMDVKFPLDNYMEFIAAKSENDRSTFKKKFLQDARNRIAEVKTRDYINPAEKTVDYVIVFIPNEQVYGFINENDRQILDDALKEKVIFCSPLTLYAILAVIHQAVNNFAMERTASQVLEHLSAFHKQWDAFLESFEKLGKKIDETQKEFNSLTTTRRKKLEGILIKIEDLKAGGLGPVETESLGSGIEEPEANADIPF